MCTVDGIFFFIVNKIIRLLSVCVPLMVSFSLLFLERVSCRYMHCPLILVSGDCFAFSIMHLRPFFFFFFGGGGGGDGGDTLTIVTLLF